MTTDSLPRPPGRSGDLPWWRCGPLWLVLGALGVAVAASGAVATVAIATGDPDIAFTPARERRAQAAVRPEAPALQGRNHAATPRP